MKNQPLHPRTEVINHKQKIQSKNARLSALAWLAEQFPKAFNNESSIHPLKIGILNDILVHAEKASAAGISKSKLREAIVIFTRRIDYYSCLKAREVRIDLDGNPTTRVTEEEAERAALKIRRRVEKAAKNARATAPKKAPSAKKIIPEAQPELLPAFSAEQALSLKPRTKPVTIKHKTARAFDPNAVARLKEKLGLAQQKEEVL